MKENGFWGLLFNALFLTFIAAPLVVVVAVSFTDKGFISMPFDGASLRWFRAILDNDEIVAAFLAVHPARACFGHDRRAAGLACGACHCALSLSGPGRADRLLPLADDDSRPWCWVSHSFVS